VLLATSVTGTAASQRLLHPWEGVVTRLGT